MSEADIDPSNFIIFGDADLCAAAGAPLDEDAPGGQRLAGIAHELAKAETAEARQALMRAALRSAGFDSLCYMRISRIGEAVSRVAYFNAYSVAGWAQRYLRERFFDIDARLAFSSRHEWPMLWDLSSLAVSPAATAASGLSGAAAASRAERFVAAAREAGMSSGVSFGLAAPGALDMCIAMFSSSHVSKAHMPDMAIGHAYALAVGLHEFLLARAPHIHRQAPTAQLSPIQRSILELVTLGLNDKDIAERLNTSHHNVDYYLRQLKKLYHAANRVQLAYIAGRALGAAPTMTGASS
ncbi:helix-turn-helix transcriptional regulator [Trinickia fusca]|uniref:LuxR family transcriptional regulator n=1 Tax=Trinickia fusca TaxID=2419777 RepID=A0A494XIN4_9BURK|nr:LuxR family transcriptional regulator [Trinickia fusca]RKP50607.1 LuxR family transcriptional regulator [Trinickia fusca]